MFSEEIELIRQGYEAMNRREFDAALAQLDARAVWQNDPAGPRGATTYVGHKGIRRFWDEFLEPWERFRFEPLEFTNGAEGRIVVRVRLTAWTKESERPVSAEHTYVWTLEKGKVRAVQLFFDHADAVAAAKARAP